MTVADPYNFHFEITHKIPGKLGRAGIIHTPHGKIKTPAFMTVGTQGYVRFVSSEQLQEIGAQAMLSNGYHLRRQSYKNAEEGGNRGQSGRAPPRDRVARWCARKIPLSKTLPPGRITAW